MKYVWFLFATPLLGQYVGGYLPNFQFSNLATTSDGNTLYFSSPLSLRGDGELPYQKIFRVDSAGIEPVVQIQAVPSPPIPNLSNFYLAIDPDLNADGSVFSYVASRTCFGGSACTFYELYESHLLVDGSETVYTGVTTLSRDGRYALRWGSTFPLSGPVPGLLDLSNGAQISVPGVVYGGRAIASGGVVLTFVNNAPVLWTQKGSTSLSFSSSYYNRLVLSDNAAAIVVESGLLNLEPLSLYLYDVASGQSTPLDQGSVTSYDASISDDGRLVCYLQNSQVVLYDREMQSQIPLPTTPDGVNEAILSGDGSTIWVATAGGRLVRIDVASAAAQEIIPRTPLVTLMLGAPVPGSLNWVYGSGLSETSTTASFPLPEAVVEPDDWVSLLVGSTPGRLASVTPTAIQYQIPFEIAPGTWELSLYPNASPFAQPGLSINLVPFAPQPVALPPDDAPVIANHDFSALIDDQNPGHPGEIIHVYFTGLGPVSPPLASGAPAPLNLLEPAAQYPSCQANTAPGETQPAQILFAGMAPGFAGVYQVDFQLPSQVTFLNNDGVTGYAAWECPGPLNSVYDITVPMTSAHN